MTFFIESVYHNNPVPLSDTKSTKRLFLFQDRKLFKRFARKYAVIQVTVIGEPEIERDKERTKETIKEIEGDIETKRKRHIEK